MPAPPAPADPDVRHWRSILGAATRHQHSPEDVLAARRGLCQANLAAAIRDALADGLLLPDQRSALADLLTGADW